MVPPWEHTAQPLQWGIVVGASLVAAACDLGWRRIPNVLTLPLLAAGLVWSTWASGGSGLVNAVVGCVILAAPFLVLFVFAGGGGGDAKLMGALGSWLGLVDGAVVLACVLLSGAVLGVLFAATGRQLRAVLENVSRIIVIMALCVLSRSRPSAVQSELPAIAEMRKMPYGIAILAGVCIAAGVVFAWRA